MAITEAVQPNRSIEWILPRPHRLHSKAISAKGQNIAANKRLTLWTRKILPIRDLLFLWFRVSPGRPSWRHVAGDLGGKRAPLY